MILIYIISCLYILLGQLNLWLTIADLCKTGDIGVLLAFVLMFLSCVYVIPIWANVLKFLMLPTNEAKKDMKDNPRSDSEIKMILQKSTTTVLIITILLLGSVLTVNLTVASPLLGHAGISLNSMAGCAIVTSVIMAFIRLRKLCLEYQLARLTSE
jgi:hypothetical protein